MNEGGRRVTGLKGAWEALTNRRLAPRSEIRDPRSEMPPEHKDGSELTDDLDARKPAIPDMPGDRSARFVLNALMAQGVDVNLDVIDGVFIGEAEVDEHGRPVHKILSYSEMEDLGWPLPADTDFQGQFNHALENTLGTDRNPAGEYARKYEQVTKVPDAKKDN